MYPATHDCLHANIARDRFESQDAGFSPLWVYDSLVSFVCLSTAAGGTDGIRATRITCIFLRGNDRRSLPPNLFAQIVTANRVGQRPRMFHAIYGSHAITRNQEMWFRTAFTKWNIIPIRRDIECWPTSLNEISSPPLPLPSAGFDTVKQSLNYTFHCV